MNWREVRIREILVEFFFASLWIEPKALQKFADRSMHPFYANARAKVKHHICIFQALRDEGKRFLQF